MTSYPLYFVTRNPDLKSLKELSQKDKVAVPSVKISTQALMLQLAAFDLDDVVSALFRHPQSGPQIAEGAVAKGQGRGAVGEDFDPGADAANGGVRSR